MTNPLIRINRQKSKVLLDIDNTLLSCTEIACRMHEKDHPGEPPIAITDVIGYGVTGTRADELLPYYGVDKLYEAQTPYEGAVAFVEKLADMMDVYFLTALPVAFHAIREKQLKEFFPFIPSSHVFYGDAKNSFVADFSLDDCAEHILAQHQSGTVKNPVLFRRPWNERVTGVLAANHYEDFLTLILTTRKPYDLVEQSGPVCLALVGPAGSGKNELAELLCRLYGLKRIRSCTTNPAADKNRYEIVSKEEFRRLLSIGALAENTCYAGEYYGIKLTELSGFSEHKLAVVDIAGAIRMKSILGSACITIYVERSDEDLYREIMKESPVRPDIFRWLEIEKKNRELLDITLDNTHVKAAAQAVFECLL